MKTSIDLKSLPPYYRSVTESLSLCLLPSFQALNLESRGRKFRGVPIFGKLKDEYSSIWFLPLDATRPLVSGAHMSTALKSWAQRERRSLQFRISTKWAALPFFKKSAEWAQKLAFQKNHKIPRKICIFRHILTVIVIFLVIFLDYTALFSTNKDFLVIFQERKKSA